MDNKTKKEIVSNCTIHKQLSKQLLPDISTICLSYMMDVCKKPLFKALIWMIFNYLDI